MVVVVVPVLSFIVSIIVAVVLMPPSLGPIVMPPVPLTANSVDGTADVDDDSLDAATLMYSLLDHSFVGAAFASAAVATVVVAVDCYLFMSLSLSLFYRYYCYFSKSNSASVQI